MMMILVLISKLGREMQETKILETHMHLIRIQEDQWAPLVLRINKDSMELLIIWTNSRDPLKYWT